MPDRTGWTRETAAQFLAGNANYSQLRLQARAKVTSLSDMATATLKRHASFMAGAELEGRWVRNYGELRGHALSERHAGRRGGGLRQLPSGYTPRQAIRVGEWQLDPAGSMVRVSRARSGSMAVRTIAKAAARRAGGTARPPRRGHPRRGRGGGGHFKITMSLTGIDARGQRTFTHLFDKGGWDAETLLKAAGYERSAPRSNRWRKRRGGMGLRDWVIEYIADHILSQGEAWRDVLIWQVWAWATPQSEAAITSANMPMWVQTELPTGRRSTKTKTRTKRPRR